MRESISAQPTTARPRILVVDDEKNIRTMLARALTLSSYSVEEASSGQHAMALLKLRPYDLMVLDIQMPDLDGIEVMQRAHQLRPELLIIVLTGHASLESAVSAVRADVVDYLLKPVGLQEIVSAVGHALESHADRLHRRQLLRIVDETMEELRRLDRSVIPQDNDPDHLFSAGPFTLDSKKRLLIEIGDPGRTVEMNEAETAILRALMGRPDHLFSFRELAAATGNSDILEVEARNLLRQYIFRLRHKIEADPEHPRWIQTVRGRGYLFSLNEPLPD